MAFHKEAKKEFVDDLESFLEKKQPVFEAGKKKSFLSDYSSAANADIYSTDFLKRETTKPERVNATKTDQKTDISKKQAQGTAAKGHSSKKFRPEVSPSAVTNPKLFMEKSSVEDKRPVSGKTGKEIISSYTDAGGGAVFQTELRENGEFRGSSVVLNKFRERTDKQGFKNKTEHFSDTGLRAVEAVKPEDNEAAASNVDDKAILATIILNEKFKDEKRRFAEIHAEKKEETKRLQETVRREQQEFLIQKELSETAFSESAVEFMDKGRRFSDKYMNAFKDKGVGIFRTETNAVYGAENPGNSDRHNAVAAAFQQKKERETTGFSNETSFDKKNELYNRQTETGGLDEMAPEGKREPLTDRFSETTVKADENKEKKSVNSYFSEETGSAVVRSLPTDQMTAQEKLDLSKSEQKSVRKAKSKAVRKAAAIAAVSNMLRTKKEIQNEAGNMNPTGDLMKDGSAGMLRAAVNGIKTVVANQIRGLLIKIMSAVMAGLMHILVFAAPLIVVVVIVIAIMTTFLSVFTDSTSIPDGDGYVYSSLAGTDIDDIIDELYMNFPAEMNGDRESLLRYALSKVGCAYDQNQHWNTTVDIFDCSSLCYRAYKDVGIDISNGGVYSAAEICREAVESGFVAAGTLLPGDLIFYGGRNNGRYMGVYHVAIYMGNGKMVEARGRSSGVVYCDARTEHVVGYSRYI